MADKVGSILYKVDVDSKEANKNLKETSENVKKLSESTKNAESSSKSFSEVFKKGMKAVVGAVAIKEVVSFIKDSTAAMQQGQQIIGQATGATGENLAAMTDNAKNAFKELTQDMGQVAAALGELNTRFGQTGQALEDSTILFGKFAKATGTDMKHSVAETSKLMNQWNIPLEQTPELLDKLTLAGQASGISVGQLTTELTANAPMFQQFGYTLDEATATLMTFEKNGINSSEVLMAMKQSLAQSAKAGTDARKDWDKLVSSIANAKTQTEANNIAVKTFGTRVAGQMVANIRSGKLSIDDFSAALANARGTLEETDKATETTADKFAKFTHSIQDTAANVGEKFAPVIEQTLPAIEKIVETLGDALVPVLEAVAPLFNIVVEAVKGFANIMQKVSDNVITPLVGNITTLAAKMGILKTDTEAVKKRMEKLAEEHKKAFDEKTISNAKKMQEIIKNYKPSDGINFNALSDGINEWIEDMKKYGEQSEITYSQLENLQRSFKFQGLELNLEDFTNALYELVKTWEDTKEKINDSSKGEDWWGKFVKETKESFSKVQSFMETYISQPFQEITSKISTLTNQLYTNETAKLENAYKRADKARQKDLDKEKRKVDKEKELNDEWYQSELERINGSYLLEDQRKQAIEELKAELDAREAESVATYNALQAQKEQADAEYASKKNAIAKKQFETQKGLSIANALMESALAVVKCFAENNQRCSLENEIVVINNLTFQFFPPTSWSTKKKELHAGQLYTAAPDVDNLAKAIFDALNGVSWWDDRRIGKFGETSKIYTLVQEGTQLTYSIYRRDF